MLLMRCVDQRSTLNKTRRKKSIRFVASSLLVGALVIVSFADQGQKPIMEGTVADFSTAVFKAGNRIIGNFVGAPQEPQPDHVTCGAATQRSIWRWEMFKVTNSDWTEADTKTIYEAINTDKQDGIVTTEMEKGLLSYKETLNAALKKKKNSKQITTTWKQGSATTIYDAVVNIHERIGAASSPAILIGHRKLSTAEWVKRLFGYLGRGSHYYGVTGGIAYVDNTKRKLCALVLNDPLYKSPAWPTNDNRIKKAIQPKVFTYEAELNEIWSKTGASRDKAYRFFIP